jgi:hypothetical protein
LNENWQSKLIFMDSEVASLFLGHSVKKLDQMTGHLETCLEKLNDEMIWSRGGSHENTVGNLILHLEGNVRQWIIHGIGGAPDVRQRPLEFSTAGGCTGGDLAAGLRETVSQAAHVIGGLSAERLAERIKPQDTVVTVLEAVYQVVGHFQQHTGQVMFATKQLTGDGLGFYQPRPPSANTA